LHDAWPALADRARPLAGHCPPRVNDAIEPLTPRRPPRLIPDARNPSVFRRAHNGDGGESLDRFHRPLVKSGRLSRSEMPSLDRSLSPRHRKRCRAWGEPIPRRSRERGRHGSAPDVCSPSAFPPWLAGFSPERRRRRDRLGPRSRPSRLREKPEWRFFGPDVRLSTSAARHDARAHPSGDQPSSPETGARPGPKKLPTTRRPIRPVRLRVRNGGRTTESHRTLWSPARAAFRRRR
jgi:hypothetical protein